ncbi:MAG: PorV/PorQ family protein [Candidatus Marinimicrobia bacterium]|nr:PorV/PorQ family protein [Candidatus Neomarinimicrobiota bacterium]
MVSLAVLLPVASTGQGLFQNLGGQRAGTAVFPFLKIETSASGAGLSGAGVALPVDASSVFYNPASIGQLGRRDMVLFHLDMAADVDYDYFALALPLPRAGTIGFSYGALHMEPMKETTVFMPFGTGRTFVFRDEFAALTYSIKLSDRFTFGTTAKYVSETLDDLTMGALLLDFGTYYMTGFRSLRLASSFSNFGHQTRPNGTYSKIIIDQNGDEVEADSLEFQSFSPPTTFRLGAGYEMFESATHRLSTSFQLTHPADNVETYALGFEYLFNNVLALRIGYVANQQSMGLSFGGGLKIPMPGGNVVRFNYAYSQSTYLTAPQRYSIGFAL